MDTRDLRVIPAAFDTVNASSAFDFCSTSFFKRSSSGDTAIGVDGSDEVIAYISLATAPTLAPTLAPI